MGEYVIDVENAHLKFKNEQRREVPAGGNEDGNPYENAIDVGEDLHVHNV